MNYNLFQKAHQPIFQQLKSRGSIGNIYKLTHANKSFNFALNNNTRSKVTNIDVMIDNIKKSLVLIGVIQTAMMYSIRTEGTSQRARGIIQLSDDATDIYIVSLGMALLKYVKELSLEVDDPYIQTVLTKTFLNHNEEFGIALMEDFQTIKNRKTNFNFKPIGQTLALTNKTPLIGTGSGLSVYKYLYKYKNVYKQYMQGINKFKFSNHNDNLQREFTLKQANYSNSGYNFSKRNLNSMMDKLNMPILGNASRNDRVAPLRGIQPMSYNFRTRRFNLQNESLIRQPPENRHNTGLINRVVVVRPRPRQNPNNPINPINANNRNRLTPSQQYLNIRHATTMPREDLEQNLANTGLYNNVNNVKWKRQNLQMFTKNQPSLLKRREIANGKREM